MSNLGAKLWDLLPREIKNRSSLAVCKKKIRKWIPEKCPCKLCQTYLKMSVIFDFSQTFARLTVVF